MRTITYTLAFTFFFAVWGSLAQNDSAVSEQPKNRTWRFAVAGDSRNCGDLIMPAIARSAASNNARFYWHLGDLRAIYDFDEDMLQAAKLRAQHLSISTYESSAWDDFSKNQVGPFGEIPFFLGIGNHETVSGLKTREQFLVYFADLLDRKELREQRVKDDTPGVMRGPLRAYFHWVADGIDFIYLDNATADQFDDAQMKWFEDRLANDMKDQSIRTVVVGMHKALSYSKSQGHSMNESPAGEASGRSAYKSLLKLHNEAHKAVYVLASHSHFYMDDIFDTPYWHSNGGVLPGWIVGTAGAHRYPLPEGSGPNAKTNVYGYLLGTVNASDGLGTIQFSFQEIKEADIPQSVVNAYTDQFVHWCFAENTDAKSNGAAAEQ
ncbi:MAG: metallophosphoesterase [Acidobacteriaceae bacterium]|nr:metallophosphoesterase [Acidobacteriaceae bacterium]